MSRSGYSDDMDDQWKYIKWRGRVASAARGKRGQALLSSLLKALDAMPEKALIAEKLELDGAVCALGAVGKVKGIDMSGIDPEEPGQVGAAFNIAPCLAQEIVYINDEGGDRDETPEQRWARVRAWVVQQIKTT